LVPARSRTNAAGVAAILTATAINERRHLTVIVRERRIERDRYRRAKRCEVPITHVTVPSNVPAGLGCENRCSVMYTGEPFSPDRSSIASTP
jgi:hypothetical protein